MIGAPGLRIALDPAETSTRPALDGSAADRRRGGTRIGSAGTAQWTNRSADPLLRKLGWFAPLSADDLDALSALVRTVRSVGQRVDLLREGERPNEVRILLDGFAVRYKALSDGQRQIIAILVPGDICDRFGAVLPSADHSISTLTFCNVAVIKPSDILAVTEASPAIARALGWSGMVDEAMLREWLLNIGQRPASLRIAHLLCEMLIRLRAVGCATENSYHFPVTQQDLAETTGLSPVHVNRTLQSLRRLGLIVTSSRKMTIPDVPRLQAFCGFHPGYLQQADAGRLGVHVA